jgi:hypothetical protein
MKPSIITLKHPESEFRLKDFRDETPEQQLERFKFLYEPERPNQTTLTDIWVYSDSIRVLTDLDHNGNNLRIFANTPELKQLISDMKFKSVHDREGTVENIETKNI